MILPQTYLATLVVMIFGMLCWGSWANAFKATRKWRFELFYFDFAFGALVAAVIFAFTLGSLGFDGFSFTDDLLHAGKRQWLMGFFGGVTFNLANMLLVAAISVAGMSVAFPVSIGLGLVIGVVWNYLMKPQGSNPILLFTGCAVIIAAIVLDAIAYRSLTARRQETEAKAGKAKSTRRTANPKGLILAIVSGVLMGCYFPLVVNAQVAEIGLGPYAVCWFFALGMFMSTFLFNMFFMNLPVEGAPVEVLEYFRGGARQHLLGLVGGIIWYTGMLAIQVAGNAPDEVHVGPAVSYAIGQGAPLISALWGLLVWKEFAGSDFKVKAQLAIMIVLFVCGLGLVSIAPLVAPAP